MVENATAHGANWGAYCRCRPCADQRTRARQRGSGHCHWRHDAGLPLV